MKKVLVVGSSTIDIYIRAESAPIIDWQSVVERKRFIMFEYGGKVNIPFFVETTGGGGTNVSAGLAKLGQKPILVSSVGDDAHADRLLGVLDEFGVRTEFVERLEGRLTGFSVIIGGYDGERTVLSFRGANNHYPVARFPLDLLGEVDAVHISSLSGSSTAILDTLTEGLKNFDGVFSWNPGGHQISAGMERFRELIERSDLLFLNVGEAERFSGAAATKHRIDEERCTLCRSCDDVCPQHLFSVIDGRVVVQEEWRCIRCGACIRACPTGALLVEPWALNLREIFRRFSEAGCGLVVITDGKGGSQAFDGEKFYAVPAFDVNTVDTLGAGDGFVSAFLAAFLNGASVKEALKWGSANGASITEKFGAKAGLLTETEIKEFILEHSSRESTVRILQDEA